MIIEDKTTLRDIRKLPELKEIKNYMFYGGLELKIIERIGMGALRNGGWKVEEIQDTVNRLCESAKNGRMTYPIYSDEEQKKDRQKRDCHVQFFPADGEPETAAGKPYLIVCAGGAYNSVWNLLESYPTAFRFSEMGYHTFTLTYRVGGKGIDIVNIG